jgi:hypothetical protein
METLYHKRALLNPFGHGRFAWMLFSHKVCRWLVPWTAVAGLAGLLILATQSAGVALIAAATLAGLAVAVVAWAVSDRVRLPAPLQLASFVVFGNLAALHASLRALHGKQDATWEPTRREPAKVVAP